MLTIWNRCLEYYQTVFLHKMYRKKLTPLQVEKSDVISDREAVTLTEEGMQISRTIRKIARGGKRQLSVGNKQIENQIHIWGWYGRQSGVWVITTI